MTHPGATPDVVPTADAKQSDAQTSAGMAAVPWNRSTCTPGFGGAGEHSRAAMKASKRACGLAAPRL